MTISEAVEAGISEEMKRDEAVFCIGTLPPKGLSRSFGSERVWQMPISEAGFSGAAVGAAICGMRPVVFWRNVTFSFVAFDSVMNQASKLSFMSGGQVSVPVVFLAYTGGGFQVGAQHSHSPHATFAQIPGLTVIAPSNPADAKGLVKSAIRLDEPVVVLLPFASDVTPSEVEEDEALTPIGVGRVVREGEDVTIVALGHMVHLAQEAADQLVAQGVSVEVIDPRTVSPLDVGIILGSVAKSGRLVVVDEAAPFSSVASEIIAAVTENLLTFDRLKAPVVRVNALPLPVPFSPSLERAVLPTIERIVSAVKSCLGSPYA